MILSKELFDRIISIIALIILLPYFFIIAILIKLDSKGPIFFLQERAGKNGKIFKIIKFRTMLSGADKITNTSIVPENSPYITRIGKLLRRYSIDELPQLLNVIKGEMSLVGPRPALPYQIKKYSELQKKRLLMKPGITSWAAINGRNKLTWKERIEYDIYYVDNWSMWLDIKIIIKTVIFVIKGEGLYAEEGRKDEIVNGY
jgi:lipopolysaccharide/colanic/teichoic acid biosynthesis glycosyltransferase